jgi:hypothetical protein
VTGGGGKVREGVPGRTAEAHTIGWAARAHFLLVRLLGNRAHVVPIGEDGQQLEVRAPNGTNVEAVTTIDASTDAPVTSGRAVTPSK